MPVEWSMRTVIILVRTVVHAPTFEPFCVDSCQNALRLSRLASAVLGGYFSAGSHRRGEGSGGGDPARYNNTAVSGINTLASK